MQYCRQRTKMGYVILRDYVEIYMIRFDALTKLQIHYPRCMFFIRTGMIFILKQTQSKDNLSK